MGLTVDLESEKIEQIAQDIAERLSAELEERVAQLVTERLGKILDGKYLVVPRLLTVEQVSRILQIPLSRARAMTTGGDIPRVKLSPETSGGSVRVDPRDLSLWLDAHQEHPARREELRRMIAEGNMLQE